jgi:hypothetical protein
MNVVNLLLNHHGDYYSIAIHPKFYTTDIYCPFFVIIDKIKENKNNMTINKNKIKIRFVENKTVNKRKIQNKIQTK